MNDPYKAIVDLAYKAMRHRKPGKPEIFLDTFPHTGALWISIHGSGWEPDAEPDEHFTIYLHGQYGDDVEKCLAAVQKAYRKITAKEAGT